MNHIPLVLFMVFSGLSMNLVLQCALGIGSISSSKVLGKRAALIQLGIIFIGIILLWVIFSKIIFLIFSGIFVYILLFPISSIAYNCLEFLTFRYLLKKENDDKSPIDFSGGITAVALFISLNIAGTFIEAAALSFGFTAGILLAFLILGEIRLRAALESVPHFLRDKPLTVISMGLLSLIFSGVSLLLFRMIEG